MLFLCHSMSFLQMFVCSGNEDLSGSIPPNFANLTRLEKLWCKNTGVSSDLPESVKALPGLAEANAMVMPPPKPKPAPAAKTKTPVPASPAASPAASTPASGSTTTPTTTGTAPAANAGTVVSTNSGAGAGIDLTPRVAELQAELTKQVDKFGDARGEIKELKQSLDIVRQVKESLEHSNNSNRGKVAGGWSSLERAFMHPPFSLSYL